MSITIKEVSNKQRKGLDYSELVLNIKNCPIEYINGIRKTVHDEVPQYGFDPDMMVFTKNTTVFNNDQLRLRLSMIPIYDVDPQLYTIPEEIVYVNYEDEKREKPLTEKKVEMYIKGKNDSSIIKNITTNDIDMFVDGKKIETTYDKNYPILITRLRQGEEVDIKLVGVINIGRRNALYCPTSTSYMTYEDEKEITFKMHSMGQVKEKELIKRGCKNMIQKLEDIREKIEKDPIKEEEEEVRITFNNTSLASVINYELQEMSKISYSGTLVPTYLDDIMELRIFGKDIQKCILKAIDKNIEVYKEIEKKI